MKKWVAALLATAVVCSLPACAAPQEARKDGAAGPSAPPDSEQPSAAQPVTINFWTWDATQHLVGEEYNKTHPDVKFEYVAVENADYLTKIQQTFASGGELPDLLLGDMSFRAALFNMDIFEPLDQEPYNFDPSVTFNYVPSYTSNAQGHIIGIENNVNSAMLAYKKDLAREYLGTDDRKEVEALLGSYDGMAALGQKVAQQSGGKVRLFAGLQDISTMMLWQRRADPIVDEDGGLLVRERISYILNAVQKFRDGQGAQNLAQNSTQWYANYAQKNNIFFPIATWGVHYEIEPNDPEGLDNWSVAIPPDGPYTYTGTCYSVCNQSKNPEAVWDFIKWNLLEPEGAAVMRENYLFMPNQELFSDPDYLNVRHPNFGDLPIAQIMVQEVGAQISPGHMSVYDSLIAESLNMVVMLMTSDPTVSASAALDLFLEDLAAKVPDVTLK